MSSRVKGNPSEFLVQGSSCLIRFIPETFVFNFCSAQFPTFKNLSELCIFGTSIALWTWFKSADNLEQKRRKETQMPYIKATESVAVSWGTKLKLQRVAEGAPTLWSTRSAGSAYLIQHLASRNPSRSFGLAGWKHKLYPRFSFIYDFS